jgi:hypothetical protein
LPGEDSGGDIAEELELKLDIGLTFVYTFDFFTFNFVKKKQIIKDSYTFWWCSFSYLE